jgi:hypothetical protein
MDLSCMFQKESSLRWKYQRTFESMQRTLDRYISNLRPSPFLSCGNAVIWYIAAPFLWSIRAAKLCPRDSRTFARLETLFIPTKFLPIYMAEHFEPKSGAVLNQLVNHICLQRCRLERYLRLGKRFNAIFEVYLWWGRAMEFAF